MRTFKVLSIDGGGIKGYYSALILRDFELRIRKENGDEKRIADYFDLICGTSTGGMIALALALKIPCEKICNFYEKHGPEIFKNSGGIYRLIRQVLYLGKYSDKKIKASLLELFGAAIIGDSKTLLCIPSFDFTHNTYALFKYDHKEGNLSRHNHIPVVDVALATSAAPTYFPLAQIPFENDTQFVDGGVWANNPSMVGFLEAITYFVGTNKTFDQLQMLSLASLVKEDGKPPLMKRQRSFINWAQELFELSLIGQNEFANVFLRTLKNTAMLPFNFEYIRIPSAKVDAKQAKYIGLDNAGKKSLTLMRQFATDVYHKFKNDPGIKDIFSTQKIYEI